MIHDQRITFYKGRVALHAILEAIGIGNGDQVLLPGYTCVVVPNAIIYRGAEPCFLEIDPYTHNIDPVRLEEGRGKNWEPKRAKALIIQHSYGLPAEMDALIAFAREYNLVVIEDSCHAFGSTWNEIPVGEFGDAAFFSSQWTKPFTTGLGGWAIVKNLELNDAVQQVANGYIDPGLFSNLLLRAQYLAYKILYRPRLAWSLQSMYRTFGKMGIVIESSSSTELNSVEPEKYRCRMSRWQERLLNDLLKNSNEMISIRKRNAQLIEEEFIKHGLPLIPVPKSASPVWLRYPIRVKNKKSLLDAARRERVELGDWFLSPVHPNISGWKAAGYEKGTCPIAEQVCKEVINLPTHSGLSSKELIRIVDFVAKNAVLI